MDAPPVKLMTIMKPKMLIIKKGNNDMKTTLNQKTVTLKLKRIEVCNLMIACTALSQGENREHWKELHAKLKEIINEFDEKNMDWKKDD